MIDHEVIAELWKLDSIEEKTEYLAQEGFSLEGAYEHLVWQIKTDDYTAEVPNRCSWDHIYFRSACDKYFSERMYNKQQIFDTNRESEIIPKVHRSARGSNKYNFGRKVCQITDDPERGPVIEPLQPPQIQYWLSTCADYYKHTKNEPKPIKVPQFVVKYVESCGDLPLRRLNGLIHWPVILPDGRVLYVKGYDQSTGLYLTDTFDLRLMTVQEAKKTLDYVIKDFPFPSEADKAAWVGMLLTALARPAIDGSIPLFLILANMAGCGKSLLVKLLSLIITGRPISAQSAPESDAEMRKRLTSILKRQPWAWLLDNVATGSMFGFPSLDAFLTASRWEDRLLSTNDMLDVPITTLTFATGNNVKIVGDLGRRVQYCELLSRVDKPHKREDFHEADIEKYVLDNRSELLSAGISLLLRYDEAGLPRHGLKPWGNFESYSRWVRETLVFAGYDDPYETCEGRDESDMDRECLKKLITVWEELDPDRKGLTCRTVLKSRSETVLELMEEFGNTTSLGIRLSSLEGRPFENKCFASIGTYKNAQVWAVKSLEKAS